MIRDQQKTQPTEFYNPPKFGQLESDKQFGRVVGKSVSAQPSRRRFIRDLCSDQIFKVSFFFWEPNKFFVEQITKLHLVWITILPALKKISCAPTKKRITKI